MSSPMPAAADSTAKAEYDVIVIGAGISGLTAAYELLKLNKNFRILILEAKDRVGGRTLTQTLKVAHGELANFDLGGMWVCHAQKSICALLEELDIQLCPQYLNGKKIAEIQSRVCEYSGEYPAIGLLNLLDLGNSINQIERCVRGVRDDEPSLSKSAEYYDAISAQALVNSVSWTASTKHLMTAAARTIWGAELNRMSALYMLTYAKSAGSLHNLVASDESSAQGFRIKGGAQAVSHELADRIGRHRLLLNSPVTSIDQSNSDHAIVTVATDDQKRKEFTARAVICSVPTNLLQKLNFTPALPIKKHELCKVSQIGHLIKFVITYETAFWRELGYSGEIVSASAPPATKSAGMSCAAISVCFDYCVSDDRHPALVALSGGEIAYELDALPSNERRLAVLEHLARFFPKQKVDAYVDFAEKNWRSEPYNGGCPVDIIPTGAAHLLGSAARSSFHRIFFAGTELATEWCGLMDGAVQSGQRTASELHLRLCADCDAF